MSIEDLRWYHWLPIGLALGAAIGGVRLGTRERFEDSPMRTIGRNDLDAALAQGLPDGRPAVADLVVHPPRGDGTWWVTGSRIKSLQLHADPKDANSPLVDAEVRTAFKLPAGDADIWDELQQTHAAFPQAAPPPSYAWRDVPVVQMTIWTLGLGALLGGVWPPVMALLLGAGFGRRSNDPAYDLSAFQPEAADAAPAAPADAAVRAVDELIDHLIHDNPPSHTPAKPAAPPVPTLSAQPLSPGPAQAAGPPKDYAGQFYPTQVHVPAPQRPGH